MIYNYKDIIDYYDTLLKNHNHKNHF